MKRTEFIRSCGKLCLGAFLTGGMLESCGTTKIFNAKLSESDLIVPLSEFEMATSGGKSYKKYVVVQNHLLQYPVCVFRSDPKKYQAFQMRCTHQGVELQVFGDRLQCPAHGSEFNASGAVSGGPATEPLRKFETRIENNELKIALR